jgi:hypothetical protein
MEMNTWQAAKERRKLQEDLEEQRARTHAAITRANAVYNTLLAMVAQSGGRFVLEHRYAGLERLGAKIHVEVTEQLETILQVVDEDGKPYYENTVGEGSTSPTPDPGCICVVDDPGVECPIHDAKLKGDVDPDTHPSPKKEFTPPQSAVLDDTGGFE